MVGSTAFLWPRRWWIIRNVGRAHCVGLLMRREPDGSTVCQAETHPGPFFLVSEAIKRVGAPLLPDPELAQTRREWNAHVRRCRALGLPLTGEGESCGG